MTVMCLTVSTRKRSRMMKDEKEGCVEGDRGRCSSDIYVPIESQAHRTVINRQRHLIVLNFPTTQHVKAHACRPHHTHLDHTQSDDYRPYTLGVAAAGGKKMWECQKEP